MNPNKTSNDRPPGPPKDLRPEAAKAWRELVKILRNKIELESRDAYALCILATSYADYREAQRRIDEDGAVVLSPTGQPMKNPWANVQKEAWERIRPLLAEFGLSPAARAKMKQGPETPAELQF